MGVICNKRWVLKHRGRERVFGLKHDLRVYIQGEYAFVNSLISTKLSLTPLHHAKHMPSNILPIFLLNNKTRRGPTHPRIFTYICVSVCVCEIWYDDDDDDALDSSQLIFAFDFESWETERSWSSARDCSNRLKKRCPVGVTNFYPIKGWRSLSIWSLLRLLHRIGTVSKLRLTSFTCWTTRSTSSMLFSWRKKRISSSSER